MLFLVIKEFEPASIDDEYFRENVIDNTVYVFLDTDFQLYVNRKDTKQEKFVPYNVSLSSIREVLAFLDFLFFRSSLIQIDMYHCDRNVVEDDNANAAFDMYHCDRNVIEDYNLNAALRIGDLSNYVNEKYSVVGFNRDSSREKSSRLIKKALRILQFTQSR